MNIKPSLVRSCMTNGLSEAARLRLLEVLSGDYINRAIECNVERAVRLAKAAQLADEDGNVALWVWSRDCDCCEGTARYVVKAGDVEAEAGWLYDRAEGPMSISIHATGEPFESTSIDRALQAFEDGHPYAIY